MKDRKRRGIYDVVGFDCNFKETKLKLFFGDEIMQHVSHSIT